MKQSTFTKLLFLVGLALLSQPLWALWPTNGDKRANLPGKLYWRGDRDTRKVALTFDDGPSDPFTSQILDILKAENVKGTFFILGKNAEKYPELAQRIVKEGHVIGNHSFSHSDFAFLTKRGSRREMLGGEEAIERVTGVRPQFFRPPHGRLNGFMMKQAQKMGLVTVEWTISPKDWAVPAHDVIVQRIVSRVKNGSIMLLHDGFFHKKPEDRSSTVAALPLLIHQLREQGFEMVTVPDLLTLNQPSLAAKDTLTVGSVKP